MKVPLFRMKLAKSVNPRCWALWWAFIQVTFPSSSMEYCEWKEVKFAWMQHIPQVREELEKPFLDRSSPGLSWPAFWPSRLFHSQWQQGEGIDNCWPTLDHLDETVTSIEITFINIWEWLQSGMTSCSCSIVLSFSYYYSLCYLNMILHIPNYTSVMKRTDYIWSTCRKSSFDPYITN